METRQRNTFPTYKQPNFILLVFLLILKLSLGKQGDGSNLPSDGQLRIGVKHRVKDCSRKSTTGDRLEVHYDGLLYSDNSKFDSSRDRGSPFSFSVGMGEVIPGEYW